MFNFVYRADGRESVLTKQQRRNQRCREWEPKEVEPCLDRHSKIGNVTLKDGERWEVLRKASGRRAELGPGRRNTAELKRGFQRSRSLSYNAVSRALASEFR